MSEAGAEHIKAKFGIWGSRSFLLIFSGAILHGLATEIYDLALPLILYSLTGSSVVIGAVRAVNFIPNLVLAFAIGVLMDRWSKARATFWCFGFMALSIGLLYFLLAGENFYLFPVLTVVFFTMLFSYAANNARAGLIKQQIPLSLLGSATSKLSSIQALFQVIGPALSGIVLVLSDVRYGLLICLGLMLVAICNSYFMKKDAPIKKDHPHAFWKEAKEGFDALRANKLLWTITIVTIFTNSTQGAWNAMLIYFAKDSLQLSASTIGILFSFAGIGGLIGGAVFNRVRQYFGLGRLYIYSIGFTGAAYAITALGQNHLFFLGLGMFMEGLFGMLGNVSIWTYRQESTPAALIGRVAGITGSIFKFGMPFAIYAAGWLAELADVRWVFLASALGDLLILLVLSRSFIWQAKEVKPA